MDPKYNDWASLSTNLQETTAYTRFINEAKALFGVDGPTVSGQAIMWAILTELLAGQALRQVTVFENPELGPSGSIDRANGGRQSVILTQATALDFQMENGDFLVLDIYQDGTGGWGLTLTDVNFPTAFSVTAIASRHDIVVVHKAYDTLFGHVIGQNYTT